MRTLDKSSASGGHILQAKTTGVVLGCLMLATPAGAQGAFGSIPEMADTSLECRFDTECLDTEACAETAFDLTATLEGTDGASLTTPVTGLLSSVAGDVPARAAITANAEWWQGPETLYGFGDGETHLLTRAEDGATVYTLHYAAGPMAITYHGHCAMETN